MWFIQCCLLQEVVTEHVCAIGVQWGFNVVGGMTGRVQKCGNFIVVSFSTTIEAVKAYNGAYCLPFNFHLSGQLSSYTVLGIFSVDTQLELFLSEVNNRKQ